MSYFSYSLARKLTLKKTLATNSMLCAQKNSKLKRDVCLQLWKENPKKKDKKNAQRDGARRVGGDERVGGTSSSAVLKK